MDKAVASDAGGSSRKAMALSSRKRLTIFKLNSTGTANFSGRESAIAASQTAIADVNEAEASMIA